MINILGLLDSIEVLHINLPRELPMLHEIRARAHDLQIYNLSSSLHARPRNRLIADEDVWRASDPGEEGKAPSI